MDVPRSQGESAAGMSREEAFAACAADSYVEFYGGRWMVVPFAPVTQPAFFTCTPHRVEVAR